MSSNLLKNAWVGTRLVVCCCVLNCEREGGGGREGFALRMPHTTELRGTGATDLTAGHTHCLLVGLVVHVKDTITGKYQAITPQYGKNRPVHSALSRGKNQFHRTNLFFKNENRYGGVYSYSRVRSCSMYTRTTKASSYIYLSCVSETIQPHSTNTTSRRVTTKEAQQPHSSVQCRTPDKTHRLRVVVLHT